jgi:hypothetical protein
MIKIVTQVFSVGERLRSICRATFYVEEKYKGVLSRTVKELPYYHNTNMGTYNHTLKFLKGEDKEYFLTKGEARRIWYELQDADFRDPNED